MHVKICGIRDTGEARLAVQAGADALGVIVGARHPTPDELCASAAEKIFCGVPAGVSRFLVTHLGQASEILDLLKRVPADVVQLHGAIADGQIERLRAAVGPRVRFVRVVHVIDRGAIDLARIAGCDGDAVVLDTRCGEQVGGTGRVHDWEISRSICRMTSVPVYLAGGLRAANVRTAIHRVRPYGVDVNSGVERLDGSKCEVSVREFVREARRAWLELPGADMA